MASIAAIAEYPERIDKIFITEEVNEAGCYAVQFYINGEMRTVVVDDYFPFDAGADRWAFSQSSKTSDRHNEIWVLILEKAWAKIFGNYQRIEAGSSGEAMYPLTGCPQFSYMHDNVQDIEGFW